MCRRWRLQRDDASPVLGALESYWASVVELRAKRIEGVALANLKRYVTQSGRAEERYRKERCAFYRHLKGPWTAPAEAKCLTDTLIDRAVDLAGHSREHAALAVEV